MCAGRDSRGTHQKQTAWRRRVGVFVCLLALLAALFGYMETPSTAVAAEQAVIAVHHAGGSSSEEGAATPLHCVHPGQCAVQAALPAGSSVDLLGSNAVRPAAEEFGGDRVVSPLRRPPKAVEAL